MTSLEKTYGQHAQLVREIYAHIETGDVEFLNAQIATHPQLLEPPRFDLLSYPGFLHYAAEKNQLAACQLFVGLGIDINQTTVGSGNTTPLALAAKNGHLEIIRWLLAAGAQVDGSPLSVATPLITAVTFGQVEAVDLLLDNHSDINRLHAKFNRTALDLARSWGFQTIAEHLEAAGAISAIEEDASEEAAPGASIVEFVSATAGWVLSEKVTPQLESTDVKLRVSCIANKNDFKLLFTLGLFAQNPRTELFICLPGNWRLPRQGFAPSSPWAFPQGLLAELSKRTLTSAPFSEGEIILRSDSAYSSLGWPADIDALIVVDKIWNITTETVVAPHDDIVKLYVLVPLKLNKKSLPAGSALKTIIEKKRRSSWKSIALASPARGLE
jgi:uncharacterized protein